MEGSLDGADEIDGPTLGTIEGHTDGFKLGRETAVGLEEGLPGETVGTAVVGLAEGDPGLAVGPAVVGAADGDPLLTVGPAVVGLEEGLPGETVGRLLLVWKMEILGSLLDGWSPSLW
jgi:hypothetical protein